MINYYQTLGLQQNCSKDDIKKAYKNYAIKLHPDKHGNDPFFNRIFVSIKDAYDVLSDNNKRYLHDQELNGNRSSFNQDNQYSKSKLDEMNENILKATIGAMQMRLKLKESIINSKELQIQSHLLTITNLQNQLIKLQNSNLKSSNHNTNQKKSPLKEDLKKTSSKFIRYNSINIEKNNVKDVSIKNPESITILICIIGLVLSALLTFFIIGIFPLIFILYKLSKNYRLILMTKNNETILLNKGSKGNLNLDRQKILNSITTF